MRQSGLRETVCDYPRPGRVLGMSGRRSKKLRKELRKAFQGKHRELFNRICDMPLKERLKAACRILFRRKFPAVRA